jgi:hypothetical protein
MSSVKIKPYPFPVVLYYQNQPYEASILKITTVGFMCKTTLPLFLKVGQKLTCQFQIPLEPKHHEVSVKVIKTWDHLDKTHLIELHFTESQVPLTQEIVRFLTKIGQL